MYPKKRPKTDEERFHEIFAKKVGTTPGAYLRRKLAAAGLEDMIATRHGVGYIIE